ncbi:MAG: hypothetical protein ACT6RD_09820 [Brevundimonas sp.]|uniref:hypothetical protein n=1 Tax=Brevundimonas sp. TaxID=1871086 RepID=UPI004034B7EE
MTAVTFRKVESRLEWMVRCGRGLRPGEALAAAAANLGGLRDDCLGEIDRRLQPLAEFALRDPATRPTPAELDTLVEHADAALTACGAVDMPLLGRALVMLCAMADAIRQADRWPPGALNPAINFAHLIRIGAVSDEEAQTLMTELDKCLAAYVAASTQSAASDLAPGIRAE